MDDKIVAKTFIHSTYVPELRDKTDAVIVSEIIEYASGRTEPNLRVFKSPKVSFWITKEQYRNHTEKKEFESLERLDEKIVYYKDKDKEIFHALNGYYPNFLTYKQRREIYQSPYIYAGNINVEALIAMRYKKDLLAAGKIPVSPTTGFLDIEQSLIESSYGKMPLISFTTENQVFLAMKRSFMYEERNGVHEKVDINDIMEGVDRYIDPLVNSIIDEVDGLKDAKAKLPFKYNFYIGETEVDMIKWIFKKIHESKVSFVGVWNLDFDIPNIIKLLNDEGIPLEEVFCDPDLYKKTGIAHVDYKQDKRKVHHFTQKWHWLTSTSYFQFIDSQSLYSYIRVVDGKEPSYKLNDILIKHKLGGKLKISEVKHLDDLQEADWHRAMLSKHFVAYALYSMWDTMSMQLMEWLNNDMRSMIIQADVTPVRFFPFQTIKVTNTLFEDHKPIGYILGTGLDVEAERDEDLLTEGGAVLEPQNLIAPGLDILEEFPGHATRCYAFENDIDFSAQYPTAGAVTNISKQTKISTAINIKASWVNKYYKPDIAVEVLFSYLITPYANGVELGHEFFNLPSYAEMQTLFKEHLDKES